MEEEQAWEIGNQEIRLCYVRSEQKGRTGIPAQGFWRCLTNSLPLTLLLLEENKWRGVWKTATWMHASLLPFSINFNPNSFAFSEQRSWRVWWVVSEVSKQISSSVWYTYKTFSHMGLRKTWGSIVQSPEKRIKTPEILERDLSSSVEIGRCPKGRAVVAYVSVNRSTWCSPLPLRNYRELNKRAEFTLWGWQVSDFCTFRNQTEMPALGTLPNDWQLASWYTTNLQGQKCSISHLLPLLRVSKR